MSTSELKVTGKSEAEVAYDLFINIARIEDRALYPSGDNPADRAYVLKTFASCMHAITNPTYYVD